jgi:hypothetical protein
MDCNNGTMTVYAHEDKEIMGTARVRWFSIKRNLVYSMNHPNARQIQGFIINPLNRPIKCITLIGILLIASYDSLISYVECRAAQPQIAAIDQKENNNIFPAW